MSGFTSLIRQPRWLFSVIVIPALLAACGGAATTTSVSSSAVASTTSLSVSGASASITTTAPATSAAGVSSAGSTRSVSALATAAGTTTSAAGNTVTSSAAASVATTVSSAAQAGTSATSASTPVSGTASVAYAGSLVEANEQVIGPAFTKATGLKYLGVKSGGSFAVAQLIAARQVQANVFESVGAAPITGTLTPKFTRWYVPFASSPLVIAYSAKSPFAAQLQAIAQGNQPIQSLFTLMEQPNFHLGRTNPATDPQGQAFVFLMQLAAQQYGMPDLVSKALGSATTNPKQIFAETALLSYLQSGQLDASSAFLSQAIQQHLSYISLPAAINMGDPSLANQYATTSLQLPNGSTVHGSPLVLDITTIDGGPDAAAGDAFVHFVLSAPGKALYQKEGYQLVPSTIQGDAAAAPADIRALLNQ